MQTPKTDLAANRARLDKMTPEQLKETIDASSRIALMLLDALHFVVMKAKTLDEARAHSMMVVANASVFIPELPEDGKP